MTALDTSELENIADLSFNDFKAAHIAGNDVAKAYYNRLAYEATTVGQANTATYADHAKGIVENDSARGIFENEYAAVVAADNSVDLSYGSDNWLRVQYDKMQADLVARQQNVLGSGTGELSYAETNNVLTESYQSLGLPSGTSPLLVPTSQLGEHDPILAQQHFQNYIGGSGDGLVSLMTDAALLAFGAKVSGAQGLSDILADYADQAHWINTMLDAFENMLANNVPIDPAVQEKLDFLQAVADLAGGVLGQLADWAEDLPSLPNLPGIGDLLNLPAWLPGITLPFGLGENALSPIVLDIDASGTIELAALNGSGSVMWDIDEDGFREASGWITGGDGLLAIDLNTDGVINDHGELFGGTNGYVTLDAYDTNSSGTITSADAQFGSLRVWVDANANGYSEGSELHTLSSLGITSISTNYSNVSYEIAGNEIKYESTFVMNDNTYTSVDAFFDYDTVNATYAEEYTLDIRTLFLPTLRGYGDLPDLHIAMSMNEALLDLVQDFTELTPQEILRSAFSRESGEVTELLFKWAGVDGVNPTSRGPYIDARVLGFLEAFMGKDYLQGEYYPDPQGANPARFLIEAWGNAHHAFAVRLAYQALDAQDFFEDGARYNPVTDSFEASTALDINAVETVMATATGWTEQFNTARFVVEIVEEVIGIGNLPTQDYDDLAALLPEGVSIEAILNTLTGPGAITGGADDEILDGSLISDTLTGNDGNDILIGHAGDDWLSGGMGNDTYIFSADSGLDYINEYAGEGTNTVRVSGLATIDVRLVTDSGGHLHIINRADGTNEAYLIASTTGELGTTNETDIGSFIQQIVFDDLTTWNLVGALTLDGGMVGDGIYGSQYNDTISGMDGGDSLYGNRGNDSLIGGAGDDWLFGGTGNDTYIFSADSGLDYINEYAGEGTNTVRVSGLETIDVRLVTDSGGHLHIINRADGTNEAYLIASTTGELGTTNETDIGSFIQQIVFDDLTTWNLAGGLTLEGSLDNDVLYGSQYNDTINSSDGNDSIHGNRGSDTLVGGGNTDWLYGGDGSDILSGGSDDDALYGGAGSDFLDGGTGDDNIDGEGDVDTVSYANAGAGVTVNLATTTGQNTGGAGTDTITNVENIIGSAYNDTLTGDGNANIIEGGAGNDTINGAGGTDTVSYASAGSAVTVNLATTTGQNTGGAGTDTITNTENLRGSAYNDTLTGTSGNNVIEGGAGNDTMNAQGGTDTLTYANAAGAVTVSLAVATGQNTGGAGTDTVSNFENLTGSMFDDVLTGSTGANTINGGEGSDTIQGGAGNDILNGGNGTDTASYAGAGSAVTVNLTTTTGQNTVGAGTDTLSGFENLRGSSFNDTLTGNASSNVIEGGAGNDTINGAGGTDTVSYTSAGSAVTVNLTTTTGQNTVGAGTDTITNTENLIGSGFNDTLTGNSSANTIIGGAGNDNINGGGGGDFLYGGAGTDTMTGSTGGDVFVFENATAFGGSDTITDFSTAQVDKLNISDLLDAYDPLNDAISDFVRITDNGTHSFLSVDADGGGNSFTQIAQLSAVTNIAAGATATETELQAMITAGTLLVA